MRSKLGTVLLHTFLMLIVLAILLPMLYTFLTSLKNFRDELWKESFCNVEERLERVTHVGQTSRRTFKEIRLVSGDVRKDEHCCQVAKDSRGWQIAIPADIVVPVGLVHPAQVVD